MDKFFKGLVDNKIEFEAELLVVKEFKALWDRDKSKNKERAFRDFTFIWFMLSQDSDNNYNTIIDVAERGAAVTCCYDGSFPPVRVLAFNRTNKNSSWFVFRGWGGGGCNLVESFFN